MGDAPDIIADVNIRGFLFAVTVLIASLLAGCNKAKPDNEAVRKAVIEHVTTKAGLSQDLMTIEAKNVTFTDNKAVAEITFIPKGMPTAAQTWTYNLESKDGKWQVVGKPSLGNGSTHSTTAPDAMGGGAGTPPEQGGAPPTGGGLPAGHPPVK